MDIAEQIKERITMHDVLGKYGFPADRKRTPCPLHGGDRDSFSVSASGRLFHCFVCGARGSVIDFVMLYFSLDFPSALAKLNEDFTLGLPIGRAVSRDELDEARKAEAARKREKTERDARMQAAERRYYDALDKWTALDRLRREAAPLSPAVRVSDSYAYALNHIDCAEYELECAEEALFQLKRR